MDNQESREEFIERCLHRKCPPSKKHDFTLSEIKSELIKFWTDAPEAYARANSNGKQSKNNCKKPYESYAFDPAICGKDDGGLKVPGSARQRESYLIKGKDTDLITLEEMGSERDHTKSAIYSGKNYNLSAYLTLQYAPNSDMKRWHAGLSDEYASMFEILRNGVPIVSLFDEGQKDYVKTQCNDKIYDMKDGIFVLKNEIIVKNLADHFISRVLKIIQPKE